jgi:ribulose-phosphate 3-epimerase
MDGKFVKSKTWPYFSNDEHSFEKLLAEEDGLPFWEKLEFEIDLMVQKPETVVDNWIIAGASRIIVHIESVTNMQEIIELCRGRVDLCVALNIDTPTDSVLPYLEDIESVQFMGIQTIGLQGQPFEERVLDKIREFHNAHPEITISCDGGVNFNSAPLLMEAGVKRFVAGSAIFEYGNIPEAISEFRKILS